MRSLSVIGGCALVVACAVAAGYGAGDPFAGVIPILIAMLIGSATWWAGASLRRTGRRRNAIVLSKVGRLFDRPADATAVNPGAANRSGQVDGRQAEFFFWLPEDYPEMPAWVSALGSSEDGPNDDREPAFGFRLSCCSPAGFEVKKWGVLPGPPFRTVKVDPISSGDEPVDFTAGTMEAFLLWQGREDCRRLAHKLILESGALQIGVTVSAITVWWPAESAWRWVDFGAALPAAVERVAELARALEPRTTWGNGGTRKCGRCAADLGRNQAYCKRCGAPWWQEESREG